eukprot:719543-Amphidinium_carterae.2
MDQEEESQPRWLESDLEHVQLLWSKLVDPTRKTFCHVQDEEDEVNLLEVEPQAESDSLTTSDVFATLSAKILRRRLQIRTRQSA